MKIFRLLFFASLLGIFALSVTPHPGSEAARSAGTFQSQIEAVGTLAYIGEDELHFSDKYRHFVAFWVLAFLLDLSYPLDVWKKLGFLTLYGIAIEGVQALVPYRECDIIDIIFNLFAIASYYIFTRFVIGKRFETWYERYKRRAFG